MLKIITDTGSDLTFAQADKWNIKLIPLPVNNGEKEYIIEKDITIEEVYRSLEEKVTYTTSTMSLATAIEVFEKYIKEGTDILYISLSSGLSSTVETVIMARTVLLEKYPDSNIHIFDSKSATYGQSIMAIKAAQMVKDGYSTEKILETLDYIRENQIIVFSVADLDHLYRGGRLSKVSAVVGGLLGIYPILFQDSSDGSLKLIHTKRGAKNMAKGIIKELKSRTDNDIQDQKVAIMHSLDQEIKTKVEQLLVDQGGISRENIVYSDISGVIACHLGPKAFGVLLYNDPEPYPHIVV